MVMVIISVRPFSDGFGIIAIANNIVFHGNADLYQKWDLRVS